MGRTVGSVVLIVLAALMAAVLAACGGGTAPVGGGGGHGGGPATASIGPAGGTLTSADGIVTLTIPKGALSKTLTFGIAPASSAPGGALVAYDITPSGTTFAVPATLTVDNGALTLPKGTTEAEVRIEVASSGAWQGLLTSIDPGAHQASASLAHLSTYGVVVPAVSSRLVLGWIASDPIVSAMAATATDYYLGQPTIQGPTVAAPTTPACAPGNWLGNRTFYDAGSGQWAASEPPSSAGPYPAAAQEAFSVLGSGTGFTISTVLHGSAGTGGYAYAGYSSGTVGEIGPYIVTEIDNPSGAQRTLTLRWASGGSFDGILPDGYAGSAQVDYFYQAADGTCSGGYVDFTASVPGKPVDTTTSYTIPAGSVKVWVQIASYAQFDITNDVMRTTAVTVALDDELDVQIE